MDILFEWVRPSFKTAMATVALILATSIYAPGKAPDDSGQAAAANNGAAPIPSQKWGDFSYTVKDNEVTITYYSGHGPDVVIPAKIKGLPVTRLGTRVFHEDLVDLPTRVIQIIRIPASVSQIAQGVFISSILDLQQIVVDPTNRNFTSESGVLYNKQRTTLIRFPNAISGTFAIPTSVTNIAESAFVFSKLTDVNVPASVTRIGKEAFGRCDQLESVALPAHLHEIMDRTFIYCEALKSVNIPNNIKSIGEWAFSGCTGLTNVVIPNTVTSIGNNAFSYCGGLTGVVIDRGVKRIGGGAFSHCNKLTDIRIPKGVTEIGLEAFKNCAGLKKVVIPGTVTRIGRNAFHNSGLVGAYFKGNSPAMGRGVFDGAAAGFTVYFLKSKTGFTTPTWKGYPATKLGALPVMELPAGFAQETTENATANRTGSPPLVGLLLRRPAAPPRVAMGKQWIDGSQYLTLTYQEPLTGDGALRIVEVSSDLVDWFSGGKHTVVVARRSGYVTVRDKTPVSPGAKRHIRLTTRQ